MRTRSDVIFLTDDNLMMYDPELAGLFKYIKKRIKKSIKNVKKKGPYIAAAVATYYGAPMVGQAIMKATVGKRHEEKAKHEAEKAAILEQEAYDAWLASQPPVPASEVLLQDPEIGPTLTQLPDGSFELPESILRQTPTPTLRDSTGIDRAQVMTAGVGLENLLKSPLGIAVAIGGGILALRLLSRRAGSRRPLSFGGAVRKRRR